MNNTMDKKELVKELEKLYNECRLQERIITQMQIKSILDKLTGR